MEFVHSLLMDVVANRRSVGDVGPMVEALGDDALLAFALETGMLSDDDAQQQNVPLKVVKHSITLAAAVLGDKSGTLQPPDEFSALV